MKRKLNQNGSHIISLSIALVVFIIIATVFIDVLNKHYATAPSSTSFPSATGSDTFELSSSCTHATQTINRAGLSVTTDIDYLNVSKGGLCMDVYRLADTSLRPAVGLLHGSSAGNDTLAGRGSLNSEAEQLAQKGFVAVNIDWPPQAVYHIQTAVSAVETALAYINAHGSTYNIKPGKVGLLGTSAGGVLTGYVATQHISYLKAVVTWSGAFNPSDPAILSAPGLGSEALQNWFGCTNCSLLPQYSALAHVTSATPPFAMFNSTNELVPLSEPEAMSSALAAAGVSHQLVVYPGTRHAVAYASDAIGPTIQWFQRYLE